MSRTTRFNVLRTLAFAGAMATAGLAAPAVSHAQAVTAERTLLNSIAIQSFVNDRSYADPVPTDRRILSSTEGERALLGRAPAGDGEELDTQHTVSDFRPGAQIDGARGLLGRWIDAEKEGVAQ